MQAPPYLDVIRAELALEYRQQNNVVPAVSLAQCGKRRRGFKYRCHNRACPACLSDRAYALQRRIEKRMTVLLKRYPGSTVVMGTFTTTDTDLPDVRGRVAAVRAAVKQMFQPNPRVKSDTVLQRRSLSAQVAVECTPTLDDNGEIRWNVHAHSLIIFAPSYPYTGASYIPQKSNKFWEKQWKDAIGPELYRSAKAGVTDTPLRALRYVVKSSHNTLRSQYRDPRYRDRPLPPALIISRADTLKGLTLNTSFGLFKKMTELAELIGNTDE